MLQPALQPVPQPVSPHDAQTAQPSDLPGWLAHCERLHPRTIDFGLHRLAAVAQRMNGGAGLVLNCPLITVAGTNGKGSTCAMLESILRAAGYTTGVHTSPHMVHFQERLRIRGQDVTADALLPHFQAVERARLGVLPGEAVLLTYFEFTLLVFVDHIVSQNLDVAILEVGLGGRLDAVNYFDADCAIITSIDLDHTEYLGDTREKIGLEKAHVMRAGVPAIVSDPMPPTSLAAHAAEVGAHLWLAGRDFNHSGDQRQWAWAGRGRRYAGLAYPALRGANQMINASGVLAALTALRERLPVSAQAVRQGFASVDLPGRFQLVPGQPSLVLDAAHNPHSVGALAANLDAMGYFPATHAIFGAMADKDLDAMLALISPLIDHWYVCDLPPPRGATAAALAARLVPSGTVVRLKNVASKDRQCWTTPKNEPKTLSEHTTPQAALDCAVANAMPTDRIVVFGSFSTVGGVMQSGLPRLDAKHLHADAPSPGAPPQVGGSKMIHAAPAHHDHDHASGHTR